MARYAITIFLSAFLLFQVQPLIGKSILPWFGGGPAVWTTCMLFFQVFLLAGYAYAHLVSSRLSPKTQTLLHIALLLGSLVLLPITPNAGLWKETSGESPIVNILALLGLTIGVPYFLLSSTGPLLQEAYRRATGRTPYRLYALSNVGSLLALLSYPFVFEPQLTLRVQTLAWSAGYALFAVLCAWCSLGFLQVPRLVDDIWTASESADAPHVQALAAPTWGDVLLWLALAACGSVMLLATTNQLCQEVPSVPFLWVVPLALYLTTFIICFDREGLYHRAAFLVLLSAAVSAAVYALVYGTAVPSWQQLAIYSSTLWVCCMICHGELVRAKPAPRFATLFYLMVSAGGALGGVLVAIVAPLVLPDFWEYHLALVATVVVALLAPYHAADARQTILIPKWFAAAGSCLTVAVAVGWALSEHQSGAEFGETNLETTRNFYGVLRVNRSENLSDEHGPTNELIHGRIRHGFQYLDPAYRDMPVSYYGPPTGVGLAILHHPRRQHSGDAKPDAKPAGPADKRLRIGVIGLGCGTIAAYGRPGDYVRYYEINPQVLRISNEYFSYRKDSMAEVEVALGDARVQMERELASLGSQQFDVLAVDAFSSDSIPMHLLTRECGELYKQHLKPDGLLCLHISNRYLDLSGVARGLAKELGWECARIETDSDGTQGLDSTTWIVLTANRAFLESPDVAASIAPWTDEDAAPLVWTDDYGSLWQTIDR